MIQMLPLLSFLHTAHSSCDNLQLLEYHRAECATKASFLLLWFITEMDPFVSHSWGKMD